MFRWRIKATRRRGRTCRPRAQPTRCWPRWRTSCKGPQIGDLGRVDDGDEPEGKAPQERKDGPDGDGCWACSAAARQARRRPAVWASRATVWAWRATVRAWRAAALAPKSAFADGAVSSLDRPSNAVRSDRVGRRTSPVSDGVVMDRSFSVADLPPGRDDTEFGQP